MKAPTSTSTLSLLVGIVSVAIGVSVNLAVSKVAGGNPDYPRATTAPSETTSSTGIPVGVHTLIRGDGPTEVVVLGVSSKPQSHWDAVGTVENGSDGSVRIASTTAWAVINNIGGCNVEYFLTPAGEFEHSPNFAVSVDTPDVVVSEGLSGLSAGLAFAVFHGAELFGAPELVVSGTGVVVADGGVLEVSSVKQKVEAAVKAGIDILFVPEGVLSPGTYDGVEVRAVSTVSEMVQSIWGDVGAGEMC